MALIAEFTTRMPWLAGALAAVPQITVRHDQVYFTLEDTVKWLFWAGDGDLSAFETALTEDPTVTEFRVVSDIPDQRLYSTTLSGSLTDFVLPTVIDRDVQLLDLTHTHDDTRFRMRVPSREVFGVVSDRFRQRYGQFTTQRLYRETADVHEKSPVSAKQRAALCRGLEIGYFDVPRNADLGDLASEFDISATAVSQRIRRGIQAVLSDVCRS